MMIIGWCESANLCMPGGNKGSVCDKGPDHCDDKSWNFGPHMCAKVDSRKNSITGRLTEERKQAVQSIFYDSLKNIIKNYLTKDFLFLK